MQRSGVAEVFETYSREMGQLLRLRMSSECLSKLKQLRQGVDLLLTVNASGEIILTLTPENPESLLRR
jgi:hypothetical protein